MSKKSQKGKQKYKKKQYKSPLGKIEKITPKSPTKPVSTNTAVSSKTSAPTKRVLVDYGYVFSEIRYITILIVIIVAAIVGIWLIMR